MVAISTENNTTTNDSSSSIKITLEILSDITTAQSAHGLKHADYDRYRNYCTRRLARIRSATKALNRNPSTPNRYVSCPITPELVMKQPRALTILLVTAERDWAFAMHTKRERRPDDNLSRQRRTVLAKLRRAVHHANTLSDVCRVVADEHTILEAEAYTCSMRAALLLECEQWHGALSSYRIVHRIYSGMAGMRANTPAAALYEVRLEEVGQGIRFCGYHIARLPDADKEEGEGDQERLLQSLRSGADAPGSDSLLADKIEAALVEARKKAAENFGEITWCGVVVPLRTKSVREAILTVMEESNAFEEKEKTIDAYDPLFVMFNDAIKVVNTELNEFRVSGTGASEDRIKELDLLVAYLSYNRLLHTIERNMLLVQSFKNKRTSKPEDFVRLYDNLITNMTDILDLPGVDNDAAIFNETESRRKVFQAHRCFHLAQCYQAAQLQSEAAALFNRVGYHAKALTGKYVEEAEKIIAESTGMKCRARAEAFLQEAHETEAVSDRVNKVSISDNEQSFVQKSLMVDQLDRFESFAPSGEGIRAICDMPPSLEAVPCKPVLFDLAIDGIRFPTTKKTEESATETTDTKTPAESNTSAFSAISSTRFGRWWKGTST